MIKIALKTNLSISQLFLLISLFVGSILMTLSMINTSLLDTPTTEEMNTLYQAQQTKHNINNIHTMIPELISYGSIQLGETISAQEFFPLEEIDDPNIWNNALLWGRLPFIIITVLSVWYITFLSYYYSRNITLTSLTFLGLTFLPPLLAIGPRMTGHTLLLFPSALFMHNFLLWVTYRSWISLIRFSILSGLTSIIHPWFFFLYLASLGYAYIPPRIQETNHILHLGISCMTSLTSAFLTLLTLGIIWNFSPLHGINLVISSWVTSWSQWTTDASLLIFRIWTDNTWGQGTLTTFFLQTPFPLLILSGLGLGIYLIHRWRNYDTLSHPLHFVMWVILLSYGIVITGNGTGGYQDLLLTYILLIPLGASTFIWLWHHQFGRPILIIIGLWYIGGTLLSFPSFLSTGNLLLRDPEQQYLGLPHQTVDQGQDLKRLALWTNEQNIDTIYVDYHGPIDPHIFLGDTYRPYVPRRKKKEDSYRAVSISQLNQSFLNSHNGEMSPGYWWLKWKHPDLIIGDSVLIYQPKDSSMPPEYQDSEIRPEQESKHSPEQSSESPPLSQEGEDQTIEQREQASQEQARELVEKQIAHQMENTSPSDTTHHYTDQDIKHPEKRPKHFAQWLEDLPREERVEVSKDIVIEGSKSLLSVVEAFVFLKDYQSLDDLEAALSDPEIYQQLVELKRIPDLRKVK